TLDSLAAVVSLAVVSLAFVRPPVVSLAVELGRHSVTVHRGSAPGVGLSGFGTGGGKSPRQPTSSFHGTPLCINSQSDVSDAHAPARPTPIPCIPGQRSGDVVLIRQPRQSAPAGRDGRDGPGDQRRDQPRDQP